MKSPAVRFVLGAISLIIAARAIPAQEPVPGYSSSKADQEKKKSYFYYGPNKLWDQWNTTSAKPEDQERAALQRLGRDTWIHWTWGNQKILRQASVIAGNLPVPVSVDFFRLLDSRNRDTRFRDFGLINEPNCRKATKPKWGLWLDDFDGDPMSYYPVHYDLDTKKFPDFVGQYEAKYMPKYPENGQGLRHYGYPTGIVGLRLFNNPAFNSDKWDVNKYFENPGKVEPPYLVGFSCGFCHMGFNPNKPPKNPEAPEWENLAANIGNQYFREGDIFLGKGRVVFGDKGAGPNAKSDPYDTQGLGKSDFLYQYAVTQQPGTSETSRFSYDFLNNPNTINPIYGVSYRPNAVIEETPWGLKKNVMRVLKDGADSVGLDGALMRVPINIGCEGTYWIDHLFNPVAGSRQRPFHVADFAAGWPDKERGEIQKAFGLSFSKPNPAERSTYAQTVAETAVGPFTEATRLQLVAEMKAKYPRSPYGHEDFGEDWLEAWRRLGGLKAYLSSYEPDKLGVAAPTQLSPDANVLKQGAALFGDHCACCHSSLRPPATFNEEQRSAFFHQTAIHPNFLVKNFLGDDRRYSVKELGTNMARALGTNAIEGDIWADFSSKDYKKLPPIGRMRLDVPVFPLDAPRSLLDPIRVDFDPPGGGRGYYRTPSLISVWATAPYLHNNSVGDYYVVDAKDPSQHYWVSADGMHRRKNYGDEWEEFDREEFGYRIDVSIDGRLKMFEDGMWKLLDPVRRHGWVKRTSADCTTTLLPDMHNSLRLLAVNEVRSALQMAVRKWLRTQNLLELAAPIEAAVDDVGRQFLPAALDQTKNTVLKQVQDNKPLLQKLGTQFLKSTITRLKESQDPALEPLIKSGAFDDLGNQLQAELAARMDQIDKVLLEILKVKVTKGMPVNLYANLSTTGLAEAALAHVRYRHDPRALATALLKMSDCPDLVEDSGHTYGRQLSDSEKSALIEFLKTL